MRFPDCIALPLVVALEGTRGITLCLPLQALATVQQQASHL